MNKVRASECDSEAKLSNLGILAIIEDSLTEYMADLKIDGLTCKEKYNAVWVFTKNKMRIFRNLKWRDSYSVESYISFISLFKINIDTLIKASDGGLVVASKIELCALDLTSNRVRKVDSVGIDSSFEAKESIVDLEFERFGDYEFSLVDSVTVKSSNIDYCNHTNNVEYLRFIFNTYPLEKIKENKIRELEIHYLNQSFEGNLLNIHKIEVEDSDLFLITLGDKKILEAKINY